MEDWRKSSYSDGNGGDCVETASRDGLILVRDTTNRDGGTLEFSAEAWQAFAATLKRRPRLSVFAPVRPSTLRVPPGLTVDTLSGMSSVGSA